LAQSTEPFRSLYPENSSEKLPSHSVWSLWIRNTIYSVVWLPAVVDFSHT